MYANNHKISDSQIKKMLVFDICSIAILIMPGIAARGAGRDGLLSILIGAAGAFAYVLLLLYFTKHIKGDYLHFARYITGKVPTFFFSLLYIIKLGFSCVFLLSLFSNVIRQTLLPYTSYRLIVLVLILVSVYAAAKGIEVRARITEILFYVVMIPLFFMFLLGLTKIQVSNLFPLFTTDAVSIFKTGYLVLLLYSSAEIVLFAAPMLVDENQKSKRTHHTLAGVAIATVMGLLLFIVVTGLIGAGAAGDKVWSSLSILQILELPGGFVQRQDALILTFWLATIFTILSTCFYYLGKISDDIVPVKKRIWYLAGYALAIFLITGMEFPLEQLFRYYGYYIAFIGLPQSILIPAIILITAKLRAKGGNLPHEKKDSSISDHH